MKAKTAGEFLAHMRREKGWTVDEAVETTRIKRKYILALEADDYKLIPGSFYVRAYIKQYSDRLGIDYGPLINYYESGQKIGEEEVLDSYTDDFKASLADFEIDEREQERERKSFHEKLKARLPLILLSGAALLILVGVFLVVFLNRPKALLPTGDKISQTSSQTSSHISSEQDNQQKTSENKDQSSTSTSKDETSKEAPKKAEQITLTGTGAAITAQVTDASNPVSIELTVADNVSSWISVTNSDLATGLILSPTNKSAQTKLTDRTTTSIITLGVVQGVSIKINGQNLDLANLTATTGTITLNITYQN
ncbi:helix-turn-helix domain-containing protein [Streptococcaceae bacterium ESL0729]|nr:helix-turn-helix domain-containing protein [Streptococcaceae bacterium ESL0729]